MSLESSIDALNETLKQILVAFQSGASAAQLLGPADGAAATDTTKPKRGAGKKSDAQPTGETVYWLIEKHNTVYEQKPGDVAPSIEGAVQVSKEVHDAKKAEYQRLVNTSAGAANAATSAHTSPTATGETAGDAQSKKPDSASSTTPNAAASSASTEPSFESVVAKFKELNTATVAGFPTGRDAVISVLKAFLPNEAQPAVSKLLGVKPNSELIAAVDKLLKPAPAADFDPLG